MSVYLKNGDNLKFNDGECVETPAGGCLVIYEYHDWSGKHCKAEDGCGTRPIRIIPAGEWIQVKWTDQ